MQSGPSLVPNRIHHRRKAGGVSFPRGPRRRRARPGGATIPCVWICSLAHPPLTPKAGFARKRSN